MKTTTLLLSVLLFSTACASESDGPIVFARASEAERHAALTAALGYPLLLGELTVRSMTAAPDDSLACLVRTELTHALLIDAGVGCTTASGVQYAGRVYVTLDPTFSTRLYFDGLRVGGSAGHMAFSGEVSRSAPDALFSTRTTESLSFDLGVPLELSVEATCDVTQTCTASAGARGELAAGGFDIAFERQLLDGQWHGWVELRGEDVLRLDLSAPRDEAGCWTYTIDGVSAGTWCGAAN